MFWPISIWPISIQRPVLFGCGVALLVVGVACVLEIVPAFLEFIEKYNGAFTALASIAIACFTLTLWLSSEKIRSWVGS